MPGCEPLRREFTVRWVPIRLCCGAGETLKAVAVPEEFPLQEKTKVLMALRGDLWGLVRQPKVCGAGYPRHP